MEAEHLIPISSPTGAIPAFQPIDPRVVPMWRLVDVIGNAVIFIALLALLFIPKVLKFKYWPWMFAGWGLLAAATILFDLWWRGRDYRAWGYRLAERVLEVRNGVLFQRTRLLPLSRLQHVDIQRGPFERRFGLASLVLHTAGTHAASITIPGLDANEAVRLRDHLVEIGGDDAV
ncbi:MAG: PH domain-containing protein [Blastocatellia bacterium]